MNYRIKVDETLISILAFSNQSSLLEFMALNILISTYYLIVIIIMKLVWAWGPQIIVVIIQILRNHQIF